VFGRERNYASFSKLIEGEGKVWFDGPEEGSFAFRGGGSTHLLRKGEVSSPPTLPGLPSIIIIRYQGKKG